MEQDDRLPETIRSLEQRIAAIEKHLGIDAPPAPERRPDPEDDEPDVATQKAKSDEEREEEIEYELGQSWFAKVGIGALALGIAFLLTLPFEGFPQVLLPLLGYVLGGGLFILSRMWKETLTLLSNYMRGAAVLLLYLSSLRLTYFSPVPTLPPDSIVSFVPLLASAVLAYVLAIRRGSVYLTLLATLLAYVTLAAIHSFPVMLMGLLGLAGYVSFLYVRHTWTRVYYAGMILSVLTFLNWAVGEPFVSGSFAIAEAPEWSLMIPLGASVIFAFGSLRRRKREEDYLVGASALLNAGGAYACVLFLTFTSFGQNFVLWHALVSATFMALAIAFWIAERSKHSTFLYAMAGYHALTVALLRAFEVPEVFVWLSVQSLVVVATAVWFRSRFIVVVNFFIYTVIFLGYLLVAQQESGFSFGFGIVALISARILNWQRKNLELKTEVMRNAYLISAFIVIPYSLYHYVPQDYVALSWVAVALVYYLLSALMTLHKYRWMGHATLMLTALYVLIIGIIQLDTTFRVISFLVLGVVLLGTSVFFTRRRMKRGARQDVATTITRPSQGGDGPS